jgi:hypothetical protein
MHVVFLYGPAASGKYTVGIELAALTGLPLFHNHYAVDAAKALFAFGTPGFNNLRATVWRAAFREAAAARRSFIFTFHPEASVEPSLLEELVGVVRLAGGRVFFVELTCSSNTVLRRLTEPSRRNFGKMIDPTLYQKLECEGAFAFPPLPEALLSIDTDRLTPDTAAREIFRALPTARHDAYQDLP